jgi:hypothetical protein
MINDRLAKDKQAWDNPQRSGYVPPPDSGEGAIRIVNGANEFAPPYSVGQISACNNASGFPVYTIVKPTANSVNAVVFTGPHAIEANGAATGTLGYFRGGIAACYAGNLASNGIGASVGTANGSWTLAANNTGFLTLGANSTEGLCFVRPFSQVFPVYRRFYFTANAFTLSYDNNFYTPLLTLYENSNLTIPANISFNGQSLFKLDNSYQAYNFTNMSSATVTTGTYISFANAANGIIGSSVKLEKAMEGALISHYVGPSDGAFIMPYIGVATQLKLSVLINSLSATVDVRGQGSYATIDIYP